jgi:hypothetical protein
LFGSLHRVVCMNDPLNDPLNDGGLNQSSQRARRASQMVS